MSQTRTARWGGMAAILGGVLWVLASVGHTFTHGSTQSPRDATLLGWESLDFFRLLAIPPLLVIVGLVGIQATRAGLRRRHGRGALAVALLGLVMIALGVILETWILDPSDDFENPIVQGGWILYLLGLFPVFPIGMILFGTRAQDLERHLRGLIILVGLLAPLQWLETFLSSVSTGTLAWDTTYAVLRGLLGVGWLLLGYALWTSRAEDQRKGHLR